MPYVVPCRACASHRVRFVTVSMAFNINMINIFQISLGRWLYFVLQPLSDRVRFLPGQGLSIEGLHVHPTMQGHCYFREIQSTHRVYMMYNAI